MEYFEETQLKGYIGQHARDLASYSQYEVFALASAAQRGDSFAANEVLMVLSPIAFKHASLHANKFTCALDAFQAALEGVWGAVMSFDWKKGVGIGEWVKLHVIRALKTALEANYVVFTEPDKDRLRMVWRAMEKLGTGATVDSVLHDIQLHAGNPKRWSREQVVELMELVEANRTVVRLDARVQEEGSTLFENLIGMDPESLTEHQQWERDLLLADQLLSRIESLGFKDGVPDELLQDGVLEELVTHANARTLDRYLGSGPKLPLTAEQAKRLALEIQGMDFSMWN